MQHKNYKQVATHIDSLFIFRVDISQSGLLLEKTEDGNRIETYQYQYNADKNIRRRPTFNGIILSTGIIHKQTTNARLANRYEVDHSIDITPINKFGPERY